MPRCSNLSALALASIFLISIVACQRGPAPIKGPNISASSAGKLAMEQYDTNGDGKVASDELDKAPSLKAALKRLDTDGDGGVSASEISARVNAWQATNTAMLSVPCKVTLDGQPLADAIVTLEPESFMGDEFKTAVGTTNVQGIVSPEVQKDQRRDPTLPGGLGLGLYKIRVSKVVNGTETIPARYNKDTILGQEVSEEDPGIAKMNVPIALTKGG